MKWFGAWQAAIWMTAVCLVLTACGGAMEESAEAPAESVDAATPELELEQPEGAAEPIAMATLAPQPTPPPTPDFGSVAYDVPSQMVRSKPVQVILLVSPSEEEDLVGALEDELADAGQEADNVRTAVLEVAKYMSATLVGAPEDAFEIIPVQATAKQQLQEDEPTQWEWTVVPRVGGTHRLILRIDRLVERDGEEELFKEEVLRDDVIVEVPVGMRLQDAWGSFDWKWLAGALLFPLFFYWLSRRDKKRESEG
jgi:hypothetical protein